MDEPNRIERMVGELIGLRMLITAIVEENGGADRIRPQLLKALEQFEVNSETPEAARRIKACSENMLKNFPSRMDDQIAKG